MRCLKIEKLVRNYVHLKMVNSSIFMRERERERERSDALFLCVFWARAIMLQIAIPRNLLKTSSSSYHVPYSAQSIALSIKSYFLNPGMFVEKGKLSKLMLPFSKFDRCLSFPEILRFQEPDITNNSP
jgi:hypothetical protein